MPYHVELTLRAERDVRHLYQVIQGHDSAQAHVWFAGLERAVLSLNEHPARGAIIPEDRCLRHLLYGRRRSIYRIIYAIDEDRHRVSVIHIRHGAQDAFQPEPGVSAPTP